MHLDRTTGAESFGSDPTEGPHSRILPCAKGCICPRSSRWPHGFDGDNTIVRPRRISQQGDPCDVLHPGGQGKVGFLIHYPTCH